MSVYPPSRSEIPVHKAAQRLRWFVESFTREVRNIEAQTGNRFQLDNDRLARVFVDWRDAFEEQKPDDPEAKQAYVGFAAGLMLRMLIRHEPVSVVEPHPGADRSDPAYYWPEGFIYVSFCLNVRGLVLETDFNVGQLPNETLADPTTWWSFRENVSEDSALAIAFLDLFAGDRPEWETPTLFTADRIRALTARVHRSALGPPKNEA